MQQLKYAAPLTLLLAACGSSSSETDTGVVHDGGVSGDAGQGNGDTGVKPDGGPVVDSGPNPNDNFTITGAVLGSSGTGQPSALENATIRATIDRNRDGTISASEEWSTTSAAEGLYTLSLGVNPGEKVVLGFARSGAASVFRTIDAAPGGQVAINATLVDLASFECKDGTCNIRDQGLKVENLPEGVSGSARLFNPVSQADAFPGDFSDASGNLLLSGVFATFDMEKDGQKLTTLAAPAVIEMRMPRDTWNIITDIDANTPATIEVPLYAFDEVQGVWRRDGTGHLEDASGATIPASTLPSIKNGSYDGIVVAVGEVTHFSTWNVDWPVESHGCVKICLVNTSSAPAAGATVTLRGLSYNGTSAPKTTGSDGCVCVEGMRSENPGEDVDQDGVLGETQTISVRVSYAGKYYDLGEHPMPVANGTCGTTGCLDLGTIVAGASNELTIALCTFHVVVRNAAGQTVEGATVYAWDDSTPTDVFELMCVSDTGLLCTLAGSTEADGGFDVTWPVLDGPTVMATVQVNNPPETSVYYGQSASHGCPTSTITVNLDEGYRQFALTVSLAAGVISWTPTLDLSAPSGYLLVSDASGSPKWMIVAEEGGTALISPVTYGTVPQGLQQVMPAQGAPPALATGDKIAVWIYGSDASGISTWGNGELTAP